MLNLSNNRVEREVRQHLPLNSLNTLQTPRTSRLLMRWLLGILLVLFVVLFLPWQQNIRGSGTLTALTPQDRPQTVQNIIAGRIERWAVREGQYVRRNDTILVISEIKDEYFDPNLPERLAEQLTAKDESIVGYQQKIVALDETITALENALRFSLEKARNKVTQARAKVVSDSTDLINERVQFDIAQQRFGRYEQGYRDGLFSLTEFETRRLNFQGAQNKVVAAENKLAISRQELVNARIELSSVQAEYEKEIAKARSDRSSAVSSLATGEYERSQLANKIGNVNVRRSQYVLRAPQDGFVVQALKAGIGETIKEGESVVTLQPGQPRKAVELFVRPMDVPLIEPGREVRLQFDGWPALQFSGWPSVSVGTFSGRVAVIDMVNATPGGLYRILVTPNIDADDPDWPQQLRVGSGVYGWVMLNDVPVWYEVWRQLNGFPPSLPNQSQAGAAAGAAGKGGSK
jgi:adhesin transport system membrane fusion protein